MTYISQSTESSNCIVYFEDHLMNQCDTKIDLVYLGLWPIFSGPVILPYNKYHEET